MKLLDDKLVDNHFQNDILRNITTNNLFDKEKIKDLENKKVLIVHNSGKEATIYKIKINDGYYIFKLYHHNFIKIEDTISFENEKYVLSITKKCIEDNICPNYIYCYKVPQEKYKYQYALLEYADGTLYDFFKKFKCTEENTKLYENIIKSILFQILVALLVLHEKYNIAHNDLHLKNIFYNKIDTNITFNYKINDITYTIETYGYLIMLGDFGHSTSYKILKEKKNEYKKYNKLNEYKRIKSVLLPLVSENYNSFKTLHNRLIMEYLNPLIENSKNLKILVEKKIIKQSYFDDAYKYVLKMELSKDKFNKRLIQYVVDNDYIDISVLLPQYMINTYIMFKNIIPYIFTFTNYLQVSSVLQMFFTSNIITDNINLKNVFKIQTPIIELDTDYRINMDIKKKMFNLEKYIDEFINNINKNEKQTLHEFAIINKSNIVSQFDCKHGVIGIDYFNKYGSATILELSNDEKYKIDNEKIIKFHDILNDLINKNICPHFFKTRLINSKYIIVEPYNYTYRKMINNIEYKTFFDKIIENSMELKLSVIFQFIVTNLCIIKQFNIDQTEIFIRQNSFEYIAINPKTIFKYVINGINYYVPTYGYLLVMHSEYLFNIGNTKIKDTFEKLQQQLRGLYNVGNCLRNLHLFYLSFIKNKLFDLNINESQDLVKMIEKNSSIETNKKFNKYKKIMRQMIEVAYSNFLVTKKTSKEGHIDGALYIRYLDFIYHNDINLLKKYIDASNLSSFTNTGSFIDKIVNEKNIDIVLEKYFNCFHTKLNSTHTFIL